MPAADTAAVMSQPDLEVLACRIADNIIAQKFDQAAKQIDELAAAVRAARDTKPGLKQRRGIDPELLAAVAIATGGGFHAALLEKWTALNAGRREPVAGLSPSDAEIVETIHRLVAATGKDR